MGSSPRYRGHTSRLQLLVSIMMIAGGLVLAGFNGWHVYTGLATGQILEISRRGSRDLIEVSVEPGRFGFAVAMRTVGILLGLGGAYVLYRWRLKPEANDL